MEAYFFKEVDGDLISLALQGNFDVIAHGCNCWCTMGAGLAPQMADAFACDKYIMEAKEYKGSVNKLGSINYASTYIKEGEEHKSYTVNKTNELWESQGWRKIYIVNAYTQFSFGTRIGAPVDYEAITLCLRKMNHIFKGKHIGLPEIGCGLAGGDWEIVKEIMREELQDVNVTIVHYKPAENVFNNKEEL